MAAPGSPPPSSPLRSLPPSSPLGSPPPSPPSGESSCRCTLFQRCFCGWRSLCSPRIPSVAPGRDYENMPAGADDRASWSVLAGYHSSISSGESLLRLHGLRVARSGRVLGRSGDPLEIWGDVDYDDEPASYISSVFATPSPDGSRSLCLFCGEGRRDDLRHIAPRRPLQLNLNSNSRGGGGTTVAPLPGLPPQLKPHMPTRPISAAGRLWAPYLTRHYGPCRLVMLRLDEEDGGGLWVEVASIDLLHPKDQPSPCMLAGRVLQGYAVVGTTILLSLLPLMQPFHRFITFDCSTQTLAAVTMAKDWRCPYIPIPERGVYVEEDDTIYFLSGNSVYAYKLCKDDDHQDQYRLAPPTRLDCLLPFKDGYGLLTHLGSRIMCAVWIGVSVHCNCSQLHALITTFLVNNGNNGSESSFVPKHVSILHSTCRQLDMSSPSKPTDPAEFRFLHVYEEEFDHASAIRSQEMLRHDKIVPSVLTDICCRRILNKIAYSPSLVLDDSAIQINRDLYIICQVPSCATVYKIPILDGRLGCQGKTLTPRCTMGMVSISGDGYDLMERPLSWHFVCGRKAICAIPKGQREIHTCSLDSGTLGCLRTRRPAHFYSVAHVINVGRRFIMISDSLEYIYILSQPPENTWMYHRTHGSFDLRGRINLSGYVVLNEDSFMVSDADTDRCFVLDLPSRRWTAVSTSSGVIGLLSGRSLYVEGFIYTFFDGGFAAHEITKQGNSYYLGDAINLPFSWHMYWESDRTCFDYVGKDTTSGAIMFCVVQGGDYNQRRRVSPDTHPISITTVQVKTERTKKGNLKPLVVGHVDIGTCFVEQTSKMIWTGFCFVPPEEKDTCRDGKENATTTLHGEEGSESHHGRNSVHQPTLKVFCKFDEGCCLAVHDGTLVLVPAESRDERQHWFRDTRLSATMKDAEGNPAFSLVNKATNLAVKHSLGMKHPVRLAKFNPENYDESLLWTESCDLGKDFGYIRLLHDISLGLDIIRAGGVQMTTNTADKNSTTVVLSKRAEKDTKRWKILYWDDEANATCSGLYAMPTCRIYNKGDEGLSLTVRDGVVCLVPSDPADKYQHWIKDTRHENKIKDNEGYPAFALVNRFSGEAIKFSGTKPICSNALSSKTEHPTLVPYNPNYVDKMVLWTESCDVGHGFRCIRPLDKINLNFHSFLGDKDHGTNVALMYWSKCDNQCWKIDYWCNSHNNNPAV